MKRSLLALLALSAACGGTRPAHQDPSSSGAAAAGSSAPSSPPPAESAADPGGGLKEVPATDKVLVFDGYDGPKGALRPLGSFVWTVVPVLDGSGKVPCTYKDMELGRVAVVGKKGDLVVLALSEEPKCHFAVAPALILDDETAPLVKGAAILTSWKDGSWYGRVEEAQGDSVTFMQSAPTAIEAVFDKEQIGPHKTERAKVRAVHDGLAYGSRAMVPNGDNLSMVAVFAATDDAVYAPRPFGTKFKKADVIPALFEVRASVGAAVFVSDPSGGLMRPGTVKREKSGVMYEVAWKNGGGTVTAGFEDVAKPRRR